MPGAPDRRRASRAASPRRRGSRGPACLRLGHGGRRPGSSASRTRERNPKWKNPPLRIEMSECINCDACLRHCPSQFGAIFNHGADVVIVPELCSGCDKCLPACPVDCIYPDPGLGSRRRRSGGRSRSAGSTRTSSVPAVRWPMHPRITRAEVEHVAQLARLALTDEEIDVAHRRARRDPRLRGRRSPRSTPRASPPTAHPLPLVNVFRPDEVRPCLDRGRSARGRARGRGRPLPGAAHPG